MKNQKHKKKKFRVMFDEVTVWSIYLEAKSKKLALRSFNKMLQSGNIFEVAKMLNMDKLAQHGNGYGLIFARTDTKGFHESIFERADAIFFIKGRIRFYQREEKEGIYKQGQAPNGASCLVIYGLDNLFPVLESSVITGRMCLLSQEAHEMYVAT